MYILREVVGEGIQEGTVLIFRHFNVAKVFEVFGVIVDSTVDDHFGSGVVPVGCLIN